jgi:hypothetical protein
MLSKIRKVEGAALFGDHHLEAKANQTQPCQLLQRTR